MIKNVDLAVEVSLAVLTHRPTHAEIICIKRISLYFRFSGMCLSWSEKTTSCHKFTFKESYQGAFTNSKWFQDGNKCGPLPQSVNDCAFTADAITVPFGQNSFDECLHSLP